MFPCGSFDNFPLRIELSFVLITASGHLLSEQWLRAFFSSPGSPLATESSHQCLLSRKMGNRSAGMRTVGQNMSCRNRGDTTPNIRDLARGIRDKGNYSVKEVWCRIKRIGVPILRWPALSNDVNRPRLGGQELPTQPRPSDADPEHHPPEHLLQEFRGIGGKRFPLETARAPMAEQNGSPDAERTDPNIKRTKASDETVQPHLPNEGRWNKNATPLFHTTLTDWGLRPNLHTEIYDYYKQLGRTSEDGPSEGLESKSHDLREILQEDALAREDGDTVTTRWVKKGEIARGAFGKVYLWEKQGLDGAPPLRMVVKDSQTSNFWHDYHAEGELIRQLNGRGCQNIVTVLDWLYKPASASHKAFVRTCYEYAEHGDLGDIGLFYRTRQLLLPEAFLWHVFRSVANALCYCRHGTNESDQTMPDWDTIVHGDVKPSNMLLTPPSDSINSLYHVRVIEIGMVFEGVEAQIHELLEDGAEGVHVAVAAMHPVRRHRAELRRDVLEWFGGFDLGGPEAVGAVLEGTFPCAEFGDGLRHREGGAEVAKFDGGVEAVDAVRGWC